MPESADCAGNCLPSCGAEPYLVNNVRGCINAWQTMLLGTAEAASFRAVLIGQILGKNLPKRLRWVTAPLPKGFPGFPAVSAARFRLPAGTRGNVVF